MKRWSIVSALGFIIIFVTFSHTHGMKPGEVPHWQLVVGVTGGLMALGGLFGLLLAVIFHLIHKNR